MKKILFAFALIAAAAFFFTDWKSMVSKKVLEEKTLTALEKLQGDMDQMSKQAGKNAMERSPSQNISDLSRLLKSQKAAVALSDPRAAQALQAVSTLLADPQIQAQLKKVKTENGTDVQKILNEIIQNPAAAMDPAKQAQLLKLANELAEQTNRQKTAIENGNR